MLATLDVLGKLHDAGEADGAHLAVAALGARLRLLRRLEVLFPAAVLAHQRQ